MAASPFVPAITTAKVYQSVGSREIIGGGLNSTDFHVNRTRSKIRNASPGRPSRSPAGGRCGRM